MDISVQTTVPQFTDALVQYARTRHLTIPAAFRDQGRLLGKRLIDFTPPRGDTDAGVGPLSQGKNAVKRDIEHAIFPLNADKFRSAKIRKAIRQRNYEVLEAIFANFSGDDQLHNAHVIPFTPEAHIRQRDRRGRVISFKHVATPDADLVRAYVEKVQRSVGQAKGGWAEMVLRFGGTLPAWIATKRSSGELEDRTESFVNSYIRIENKSRWATGGDEERIVPEAIRSRSRDMLASLDFAENQALKKARLA